MSRIYQRYHPYTTGDTFTPVELIGELRDIHGEFNGCLDSDNLANNLITADKIAVDAMAEHYFVQTDNLIAVTVIDGELSIEEHSVPSSYGGNWDQYVTTRDCMLVVEARAKSNVDGLQFMLKVDGEVIARRAPGYERLHTASLRGATIVGAGEHVIEFVFSKPGNSADTTITFYDRLFSIREAMR